MKLERKFMGCLTEADKLGRWISHLGGGSYVLQVGERSSVLFPQFSVTITKCPRPGSLQSIEAGRSRSWHYSSLWSSSGRSLLVLEQDGGHLW